MKKKVTLIIVICIIVLVSGTAAGIYYYIDNQIHINQSNQSGLISNDVNQPQTDEIKGITNILLIGLDGRNNDEDARTDSIILSTIDSNNKKIKLTSFMRDMYVPIPQYNQNRINEAYKIGGSSLLLKTLSYVFNIDCQYFVSIDFKAFQDVIDKIDGIDIDIKSIEIKEINKYIQEVNGDKSQLIKQSGLQHINGQQALSYCRIRKVGNNDYERTERQRKVISTVIQKLRKQNIVQLSSLLTSVLSYIHTNIPTTKLINIAYTAYKFGNTDIDTMRVPVENGFSEMNIYGADVLVPNLDRNISELNNFIYSNGGSIANIDMPIYMMNNYHFNDISIDRKGLEKAKVNIIIPKIVTEPKKVDPSIEDEKPVDIPVEKQMPKDVSPKQNITP